MYEYLDRPLGDLAEPDLFMVSAMRCWVAAARGGRCACRALHRGFADRGLAETVADFGIAMATLDRDGSRRLHFAPVEAPVVTDDEARVLALFACGRGGTPGEVRRTAAVLVEEEARHRLERAVALVGAAMVGDAA